MKKNILVVSDSRNFYAIIEAVLRDKYTVLCAETEPDAFSIADKSAVSLIITPAKIKERDVFYFLEKLRGAGQRFSEVPVFIATAFVTQTIMSKAHKYNVADLIKLPFEPLEFDKRVEETILKFAPSKERPDPVTGLRKKQYAEERVAELLAEGRKGALLLLDLDHYSFASTAVSEKTLIDCKNIIKEEIDGDAVFTSVKGGGFLVFVPDLRDREKIEAYAESLISKILEKANEKKLFVSIGLAVSERHGNNYVDLYQACDKGLGLARAQGKNTAKFYTW